MEKYDRKKLIGLVGILAAGFSIESQAAIIEYDDLVSWQAAIGGYSEALITDSAGIAQASELGSQPAVGQNVGEILTFETTQTGLSRGFQLEVLEIGADFIFSEEVQDTLSVGQINQQENDDWILTLTSGALMTSFAFVHIGTDDTNGESITFINTNTGHQETKNLTLALQEQNFLGFTTDFAFNQITFDEEDTTGDDTAIGNMYFQTVPIPGALYLFGSGVLFLYGARRKSALRVSGGV